MTPAKIRSCTKNLVQDFELNTASVLDIELASGIVRQLTEMAAYAHAHLYQQLDHAISSLGTLEHGALQDPFRRNGPLAHLVSMRGSSDAWAGLGHTDTTIRSSLQLIQRMVSVCTMNITSSLTSNNPRS